jgi:UDP-N-acetylglucosamine--N-acetylmuramyl-(pentapeptide) pyrophosphoryl-undecaprenol N-acetylglucosamine transferase
LVPRAGYQLERADLRGLERELSPRLFLFLWSLFHGSLQCLAILRRSRPDVVVGVGGYVSAAPVFWAAMLRIPTLIVELDSHMGLANRFLSRFADRVVLSFPLTGRSGKKYMRAGRPMSQELLEADAAEGRRLFGLDADRPVVLVYGGSQGARSINRAVAGAFGSGALPFQLVHISGRRDYHRVRQVLEGSGYDRESYHLLDYTDDLPLAMAAADLVVGRSGASVLEIAALGKPALLVPYPHATADHQRKNAEWMAAAGAAGLVDAGRLDAELLRREVTAMLEDRQRLEAMAAASGRLGSRDGAAVTAEEILKIAGKKGKG